jgi:hypothetical protein
MGRARRCSDGAPRSGDLGVRCAPEAGRYPVIAAAGDIACDPFDALFNSETEDTSRTSRKFGA